MAPPLLFVLPLDPATAAPPPFGEVPALPGTLPPELGEVPAVEPDTEPAAAPPLEPVPGDAGDGVSEEQPLAASRAADHRVAPAQRAERTGRERKAVTALSVAKQATLRC